MDLKKVKPSKNFRDKTGQSERGKMVDYLLGLVNPKTAYHNVRDAMLRNGMIDAPERTINYRMVTEGMPNSKNFIDRTGGHQDFITGNNPDLVRNQLFFDMLERARREGQIGPLDYMIQPAPPRTMIDPRKRKAPYL
jgi:hypothetical protein